MSIIHLIVKEKMVLNLIYLFSECREKCNFSNNSSNVLSLSLNIFILHRLRNKFLQLILISLDSASWELHQYLRRMCGPMKNPKVETRSQDSNLGPHDCKADALPHDHGHHNYYSSVTTTVNLLEFAIKCLILWYFTYSEI